MSEPNLILRPLPALPIVVRLATAGDLPFIDALQKKHEKMVGWMPMKQLEEKVVRGEILVAEEVKSDEATERQSDEGKDDAAPSPFPPSLRRFVAPSLLGYAIFSDRYFKRDDVGIIYALNVVPGRQRGLVGATLLKAVFERAAYGCRLFCCWCAQDIEANKFWEAMGFVALAFRSGGRGKKSDGATGSKLSDEATERRSDGAT